MNGNIESTLTELEGVWKEALEYTQIVGSWLWIEGAPTPTGETRTKVQQMGWRWNWERKAWQHPCGKPSVKSPADPRDKYGSIPVIRDNSAPWWNQ